MIAIDLGSNTIRFLAAECDGATLWERQRVVRTAEGLLQSGLICQEAIDRILAAIKEARGLFDFTAHPIAAVTTEALRQAKNRDQVLKQLHQKSGIRFELIDAQKEARLTALATAKAAGACGIQGDLLVLDIGGASSETIWIQDGIVQEALSLPVGIVTATERGLDDAALKRYLADALAPLDALLQKLPPNPQRALCATAGTPTTLAAIKLGLDYHHYDKEKINGTPLSLEQMQKSYEQLSALPQADLEAWVGKRRTDVVLTGTQMLIGFTRYLGFDHCIALDEGLREGVLAAACAGEIKAYYLD